METQRHRSGYTLATAKPWLEQMEQVCENAGIEHVDILLDQAAWMNAAMPMLQIIMPVAPWFSLFTGTPEEHLLHKAPLLIRLTLRQPQHRSWLIELLTHCARERLLALISPLPFEVLSHALRALCQAERGGRGVLLRYYDPRVFPLLVSSVLTVEQRMEFRRVAYYWTWVDRDDQPQWLLGGTDVPPGSTNISGGIELTDLQCDALGCISDAHKLMMGEQFAHLGESNEKRFSFLYKCALEAAGKNYFGDLAEYVGRRI
jgi:hypothetical protein